MAEQTKKKTVKVTYGWDTAEPKTEVALTLFPSTNVAELLRRLGTILKKSDLAFFHGGVELDATKTLTECNLPEGTILTVFQAPAGAKTRAPSRARGGKKRKGSASPEPEDMQKTPKPPPTLQWASVKAPVKEKTPEAAV
jgi:hypothetical protein